MACSFSISQFCLGSLHTSLFLCFSETPLTSSLHLSHSRRCHKAVINQNDKHGFFSNIQIIHKCNLYNQVHCFTPDFSKTVVYPNTFTTSEGHQPFVCECNKLHNLSKPKLLNVSHARSLSLIHCSVAILYVHDNPKIFRGPTIDPKLFSWPICCQLHCHNIKILLFVLHIIRTRFLAHVCPIELFVAQHPYLVMSNSCTRNKLVN